MKKYLPLIFLFKTVVASAQITFQKTYGLGTGVSIQQTSDNGYVIAVRNPSTGLGKYNKLNEYGDTLWTKTVYSTTTRDIRQVSGGGYIYCGSLPDSTFGNQATLTKANSQGDSIWRQTFLPENIGRNGISCLESFTGGYLIGSQDNLGAGHHSYLLTLTDTLGNYIWEARAGSFVASSGSVLLRPTLDSNYITTSTDFSGTPGSIIITKTNRDSTMQWNQYYGDTLFNDQYIASSVSQNSDSTYIVAGSFINTTDNMFLMKTDKNGDSLWSKSFLSGTLNDVIENCQGGYIGVGGGLIINFDQNGDTLWTQDLTGLGLAEGLVIQRTNDSGFVIVGSTTDTILNEKYVYVVKTDCMGNSSPLAVAEFQKTNNEFSISPNPASSTFTINSTIAFAGRQVEIYNLLGEKIFSTTLSQKDEMIDVEHFSPGLYFVKIRNGENSCVKKLVVE